MPFYHAQEATEAVKKVLGDRYMFDSTPWYVALYNSHRNCQKVKSSGDGTYWFTE
jgi:omega-6 fatty acid desaturase (delta-12 desaturase)